MKIQRYRRESFDEYRIGLWIIQFFEFKLWRFGVKFKRFSCTESSDTGLIETPLCWVLALPMMSITKREGQQ